jgi:anaerobic magnesium-protoporphyrin IX monomethyl ester cyclase
MNSRPGVLDSSQFQTTDIPSNKETNQSYVLSEKKKDGMKILFLALPKNISVTGEQVSALKSPPTTFIWLSGILIDQGHEASILDANTLCLNEEEISQEIRRQTPDVIGFTVFTSCYPDVLYMAKKVRENFPHIKIAVGGYHVNSVSTDFMNDSFDLIFKGEAEISLLETMNRLGRREKSLDGIPGLIFFDKEKADWIEAPPADYIPDFDDMPLLPYDMVAKIQYNTWWTIIDPKKHKYMATVTGKGCPVNCSFCDVTKTEGLYYRAMSPKRVVKEFAHMYFNLGITHIEIRDPFFTIDTERVREISQGLIDEGIKVEWGCSSTAQRIRDIDLLKVMRKSGCRFIFVGVESGHAEILKREKNVTPEQVFNARNLIRKSGMQSHFSFIFGLEGENETTLNETLNFALALDPDTASFSIAMPFPGTQLYNSYKEKGYINTFDWKDYGGDHSVFETEDLSSKLLETYVVKAHRKFYFRPSYILRRLLSVRTFGEIKFYVSMGFNMIFDVMAYKR